MLGSLPLGGLLLVGCFDGLPNTNPRVVIISSFSVFFLFPFFSRAMFSDC